MKTLIADAWRDFEIQIVPLDASEVQRTECRRAFYAGAISMWSSLLSMLDPGVDPTENDMKAMDGVKAEIDQYAEDLRAGRM